MAKTPRGMELVSMARSQSVLRRNKKRAEVNKAEDKEQVDNPDEGYVPRRLRPGEQTKSGVYNKGIWSLETNKTPIGFNILLPDYAEKKDAAITDSLTPRSRANSLLMGVGFESSPKAQLEEVSQPEKGRGKWSVLGKLTHAKKNALRLFHGGQSPKKFSEEPTEKSPKNSSPQKKENTTPLFGRLDLTDFNDVNLHPNPMHSTRSLWGHFGRGSKVYLVAKGGDAAHSAPTRPPLQKSPKKPKHKASVIDFEKSTEKLKHKASLMDFEKSPGKLKHNASAIDLETAAAAAKAATRRKVWLLGGDDESNQEYA